MRAGIFFALCLLSITFLISEKVSACRCDSYVSIEAIREAADIVFIGTVIKAENSDFVFAVEEVLKGTTDKEITVNGDDPRMCGMSFELGATYIISASIHSGGYVTNRCVKNELLRDARANSQLHPAQASDSRQRLPIAYIVLAALGVGLIAVAGVAVWFHFFRKAD